MGTRRRRAAQRNTVTSPAPTVSGHLPIPVVVLTSQEITILSANYSPDSQNLDYAAQVLFRALSKYPDYQAYRLRVNKKHRSRTVWGDPVEMAFLKAALVCRPAGRAKVNVPDNSPMGRNEIMTRYIYRWSRQSRHRKQVSSHLQTLKEMVGARGLIAQRLFSESQAGNTQMNPSATGQGLFSAQQYTSSGASYNQPMGVSSISSGIGNIGSMLSNSYTGLYTSVSSPTTSSSAGGPKTVPSISLSAFGIYLTPSQQPRTIRHTFTSLTSRPQQEDMASAVFSSTKKSKFYDVANSIKHGLTNCPIILATSSMNTQLLNTSLADGADLTIALEMSISNMDILNSNSLICSTTTFNGGGDTFSTGPEKLHRGPGSNRILGFGFGTTFWSKILGNLTQNPQAASDQLSKVSATQEIWCGGQLVLIVCWEFSASAQSKTTWRCLNNTISTSTTTSTTSSTNVQPFIGMTPLDDISTFEMPSTDAFSSLGMPSLNASGIPMMGDVSPFMSSPSVDPNESSVHVATSLDRLFSALSVTVDGISTTPRSVAMNYLSSSLGLLPSNDICTSSIIPPSNFSSSGNQTSSKRSKKQKGSSSVTSLKGSIASSVCSMPSLSLSSASSKTRSDNGMMSSLFLDPAQFRPLGIDSFPAYDGSDPSIPKAQVMRSSTGSIFGDMPIGTQDGNQISTLGAIGVLPYMQPSSITTWDYMF